MSESPGKLRLGALVALVVGSMIGGGIFSLPQNMAASADVGAVLIGWVITAIGMLTLAFVFQTLANRKPDLDGGVYAYAKAGLVVTLLVVGLGRRLLTVLLIPVVLSFTVNVGRTSTLACT